MGRMLHSHGGHSHGHSHGHDHNHGHDNENSHKHDHDKKDKIPHHKPVAIQLELNISGSIFFNRKLFLTFYRSQKT